jgi:Rod binding domain-containing protein
MNSGVDVRRQLSAVQQLILARDVLMCFVEVLLKAMRKAAAVFV